MPTAVGSQVKPCCSRLDLYKEHAGIDLRDDVPADEVEMGQGQDRHLDLGCLSRGRAKSCSRPAIPVGLPMGQTSDAVDWVGALFNAYGVVMVDAKDNIKINSDETRAGAGIRSRSSWR